MPFYPTDDRLPWAEGGGGNFRSAALVGGRPPPLSASASSSWKRNFGKISQPRRGKRRRLCEKGGGWRKGEGNQF